MAGETMVLPAATRRGVRGWPQDGASARRLLLAGAAVLTGLSGVLLGTAPSGIEPGGEWVHCGRALFHDPNRLPHPDCAASYEPFESAAITLLVISVVLLFLVPFQRAGRTGTVHPQPVRDTFRRGGAASAPTCTRIGRPWMTSWPRPGGSGRGTRPGGSVWASR